MQRTQAGSLAVRNDAPFSGAPPPVGAPSMGRGGTVTRPFPSQGVIPEELARQTQELLKDLRTGPPNVVTRLTSPTVATQKIIHEFMEPETTRHARFRIDRAAPALKFRNQPNQGMFSRSVITNRGLRIIRIPFTRLFVKPF